MVYSGTKDKQQEFQRLRRVYEGRADFSASLPPLPTERRRQELQKEIERSRDTLFTADNSSDNAIIQAGARFEDARKELELLERQDYAVYWAKIEEEALQACSDAGMTRSEMIVAAVLITPNVDVSLNMRDLRGDQWLALAAPNPTRKVGSLDMFFSPKTVDANAEPCPLICGDKLDLQDRALGVYWCAHCRRFFEVMLSPVDGQEDVIFFSGLSNLIDRWRRMFYSLTSDDLRAMIRLLREGGEV
jgi:hypothetical protein